MNRIKICANINNCDLSREEIIENVKALSVLKTKECQWCKTQISNCNFSKHSKVCKKIKLETNRIEKINESLSVYASIHDEISKLRKELLDINRSNIVNSNNNNNTFISIANFGKESYDHITNDFMKNCIMNNISGVKQLIEKIHFSEEAPCNKNVRLKSLKNNLVEVSDNKKWVVKDANEAMETMINKGCKLLNGFYLDPETGIMEYDINELDLHIQNFLLSIMDKNNKSFFALRRRILALIIDNTDGL
jgi:uncharacterized protein YjgD (DUF1641 family)